MESGGRPLWRSGGDAEGAVEAEGRFDGFHEKGLRCRMVRKGGGALGGEGKGGGVVRWGFSAETVFDLFVRMSKL